MKIHEYNQMMAYMLRPRQKFANGGRIKFQDGLSAEMKARIKNFESMTGQKYEDQPAWRRYDIREGNWKGTGSEVKLTDEMKANIKEFEQRTGQKYEDLDVQKKKAIRDGKRVGVLPTKEEMKSRISVDDKGVPKFPNKEMEKQFIEDVKKKLKFPKASKNIPDELKAKGLSEKYPISERQVERAIRYYREKLKLSYPKGMDAPEFVEKRKEYINKNSNRKFENLLKGNPEFHKSHMSDLYTQKVKTGTLGYARASVNIDDLKDIDAKMNALYEKTNKLLKNKPKNLNILLDEINQKGTDLAAQSGGYKKFEATDPFTKKKFVINFSSAAQELDPTDILENKNLSELTDIDKPTVLTLKEESLKNIQKIEDANIKLSANPFLDPKNILTGLSDVAKVFSTPSVAATYAGTAVKENLEKGESLAEAFADVEVGTSLLYPELAKRTVGQIAPKGTGILSTISRVAANPFFRAARAFTPVGAGLTAVGLAKDAYERYQELEAMSPEEREDLRIKGEEFAFGDFA